MNSNNQKPQKDTFLKQITLVFVFGLLSLTLGNFLLYYADEVSISVFTFAIGIASFFLMILGVAYATWIILESKKIPQYLLRLAQSVISIICFWITFRYFNIVVVGHDMDICVMVASIFASLAAILHTLWWRKLSPDPGSLLHSSISLFATSMTMVMLVVFIFMLAQLGSGLPYLLGIYGVVSSIMAGGLNIASLVSKYSQGDRKKRLRWAHLAMLVLIVLLYLISMF